jgi:hypothetical protein
MTITWDLTGADIVQTQDDPDNDIPADCLARSDCDPGGDPDFGTVMLNVLDTDGTCEWWDPDLGADPQAREYIRCSTATVTLQVPKEFLPAVDGTVTRTYELVMTFRDSDGNIAIASPTATRGRTRDLATTSPADASPGINDDHRIEITITQTHTEDGGPGIRTDIIQITADADTTGTFSVAGVQYDLDVDAGELPGWLIDNDWHHHVYAAYSLADAPGNASTCDVSGPCLRLDVERQGMVPPFPQQTNIRGLVLAAGSELAVPRAGGTMDSYFEAENDQNATPGVVYSQAPLSTTFNDQVRVLGTAP